MQKHLEFIRSAKTYKLWASQRENNPHRGLKHKITGHKSSILIGSFKEKKRKKNNVEDEDIKQIRRPFRNNAHTSSIPLMTL